MLGAGETEVVEAGTLVLPIEDAEAVTLVEALVEALEVRERRRR